jgi:DNA replicative helicase MCM subunit Mcm2 (Cdc46/Mcm family)
MSIYVYAGVYTSGKGSSAAGLTASVIKVSYFQIFYVFLVMPYCLGLCVLRTHIESRFCNPHVVIFAELIIIIIKDTRGEFYLEGGAMVLADGGGTL